MIEKFTSPVIIYDGFCNFCISIITFIIQKDKEKKILFAPIQHKEARILLKSLDEPFASLKTVYFIHGRKVYKRSTAAFKTLSLLPYPWKALSWLRILPVAITDVCYKIIAKNRYNWFGKKDQFAMVDAIVKERYLTSK